MSQPRAFRLILSLVLSRFLGGMTFQFLTVYGLYSVYDLTKSPALVGMIGLFSFVPTILLTFWAGHVVDRSRAPGRLYVVIQGAIALCALGLWAGAGHPSVLYVCFGVFAGLKTFRSPIFYSLIRRFQDEGVDTSRVVRWMSLSWQLPLMLSPLLFSVSRAAFPHLDAVVILVGLATAAFLASVPLVGETSDGGSAGRPQGSLNDLFRPVLLLPLVADGVVMALLSFGALIPFLLVDIHASPSKLGYVRFAMNGAAVVTSVFLPRTFFHGARSGFFYLSLLLVSFSVMGVSSVHSLSGLVGICGAIGVLDGFSVLYRDRLILERVSHQDMGRVSALNQIFVSLTDDFGEARAGMFAEYLGVRSGILFGALFAAGLSAVFIGIHSRMTKKLSISWSGA